jgi:hypothetical protein
MSLLASKSRKEGEGGPSSCSGCSGCSDRRAWWLERWQQSWITSDLTLFSLSAGDWRPETGDTLTRFMSTVVLLPSLRDMKPFVRRVQRPTTTHPHSSTIRPTFEPKPKAEPEIARKRTFMTTNSTSESDALMQYLLRPMSTLSCFVSDIQNMAKAPGFGLSHLRFTEHAAYQLAPLQTMTAFTCLAHIHVGRSASSGSWWVYGNQIRAKSVLLRVSDYPSIGANQHTKRNDADSG